jgi:hypothetical protein
MVCPRAGTPAAQRCDRDFARGRLPDLSLSIRKNASRDRSSTGRALIFLPKTRSSGRKSFRGLARRREKLSISKACASDGGPRPGAGRGISDGLLTKPGVRGEPMATDLPGAARPPSGGAMDPDFRGCNPIGKHRSFLFFVIPAKPGSQGFSHLPWTPALAGAMNSPVVQFPYSSFTGLTRESAEAEFFHMLERPRPHFRHTLPALSSRRR